LLAEAEKKQLNFTGPFLFLSDVFIHLKRKKTYNFKEHEF